MTYQDIIDEVRIEVDDPNSTRWEDDAILSVLCRSVRRLQYLITRHDLPFGKAKKDFDTTASTEEYVIGSGEAIDISDFGVPIGLYRTDTNEPLNFRDVDTYERLDSNTTRVKFWTIYGDDKILIKGVPDGVYSLRLWYWPQIDYDVRVTDTMPYPRLADLLVDYTSLRLKNIDEMSPTVDVELMKELEARLLDHVGRLTPIHGRHEGPLQDLEY